MRLTLPEPGQIVIVWQHPFVVSDVASLVAALNATVKSSFVYTPDDAIVLAADYLGNKRMTDPFRERLEFALLATSRHGLLTPRGEEIRQVT